MSRKFNKEKKLPLKLHSECLTLSLYLLNPFFSSSKCILKQKDICTPAHQLHRELYIVIHIKWDILRLLSVVGTVRRPFIIDVAYLIWHPWTNTGEYHVHFARLPEVATRYRVWDMPRQLCALRSSHTRITSNQYRDDYMVLQRLLRTLQNLLALQTRRHGEIRYGSRVGYQAWDVINDYSCSRATVVHRSQAVIPFLSRRVPYVELYSCFVQGQNLGEKCSSYSGFLHMDQCELKKKKDHEIRRAKHNNRNVLCMIMKSRPGDRRIGLLRIWEPNLFSQFPCPPGAPKIDECEIMLTWP